MKRAIFIAVGTLVFAAIGFVVGSFATNWYSDHVAKSDDDINVSVGVFLVLWPLFAGLGAYLGNKLCGRSLSSDSP